MEHALKAFQTAIDREKAYEKIFREAFEKLMSNK
jgi:hypothetical protein